MEFVAEDYSEADGGNTSNVSHGSRSVLKELNCNDSNMLSPLGSKSPSTNKLPQSPHLQPQTTPSSYDVPLSSTVAAGSAVLNSSISKLRIDSEIETPRFNETHLVSNNNNNKSNKFVGLTEFDESKIPELPSNLKSNISDQIKLTFEEDLIPTLTANTNTELDLTSAGDAPSKTLQVLTYETDTALSSDNETYAECQSFLDLVHANSATSTAIHLEYGGNTSPEAMSEADTYRSALSMYSNTVVSTALVDENDTLDATMENVDDICDEQLEPIQNEQCWQELRNPPSHSTKRYSLGEDLVHTVFDGNGDEPMDISISERYDLPQNKQVQPQSTVQPESIVRPKSTMYNHENPASHNRLTSQAVTEATLPTGSPHTYSPLPPDQSVEKLNPYIDLPTPAIKVCNTSDARSSLGALENVKPQARLTFSVAAEANHLSSDSSTVLESELTKANMSADEYSQMSHDEVQAPGASINNEAESTLGTLEKAVPQNRLTFSYTRETDLSPGCINDILEQGVEPESLQKNEPAGKRRTFSVEGSEQQVPNNEHASPAGACNVIEPESRLSTLANVSTANRLTFSVESAEHSNLNEIRNSPLETVTVQNTSDANKTRPKKNHNLIQDNSVDSATDIIPSDTPVEDHDRVLATINSPITDSGNATQIITSTGVVVENGSPYEKILNSLQSSSSALPSVDKMNLTSNDGSSFEVAPSTHSASMNSLSFPLKPITHRDHFPRSPDVSKASTFLEKSDYVANSAIEVTSPKKGIECKNDSACSSNEHNLNETKNMSSSSVSTVSITQNSFAISNHHPVVVVGKSSSSSQSLFNCTFDECSLPSPSMSSSTSELHTMHIVKHHASGVSTAPKSQSENSLNLTRSISPDTFSVTHPTELEACNESVEAMDVDCSMQGASVPQALTPKILEKHPASEPSNSSMITETLSAKELTKSNVNDEKDILVETIVSSGSEKTSATIGSCSSATATDSSHKQFEFSDEDFQNNLILNPSDFDYLLTKGNSNVEIDRSSLLLKFDPLLGVPIPVNQPQHYQQIQKPLSPTLEEDELQNERNRSFACGNTNKAASASNQSKPTSVNSQEDSEEQSTAKDSTKQCEQQQQQLQQQGLSQEHTTTKKNARMSVDVIKDMKIENENCNKTIESSNTQADEIQNNFRMDELENKIKNEILKTEDIEKKLKEAEQREEAVIKRITEKDKTISKMNGVIEAYEKAIAELISEKEQLIQSYEKQLAEVKADRDSNYHHLNSLETTFSDLHVKYEKSKEMTLQLKSNEESMLAERKQNLENLRLQEQRYEKMKNHAMQQLEIANKKLECLTKDHAIEATKLKALLKKEEISRASISEQLQQKTRENAELVKICDELINGQGS